MLRRLSILLACVLLVACAQPFATSPVVQPSVDQTPTASVAETATVPPTIVDPTATPTLAPTEQSEPTATVEPTEAPEATPTPTMEAVGATIDDPERIAAAVPMERDQRLLVEAFKNTGPLPEVARTTPLEVEVGDVETFWVTDALDDHNYQISATLRYAGPHVLMYVDTTVDVEQSAIEASARVFEDEIYPRTRALFGEERSPGIDGDPRLTVLNTPVRGAGGYFSSSDGVVKAVNRFSNEREMFVIGIDSYPIGTDAYASTLAHEFQHMIEFEQARRSPSWFNEGMSTLAEDLNGYVSHGTARLYLANPDVQLTGWSSDAAQSGEHYGTSQLFMRYIHEHYAGDDGLAELIQNDAGNNLDAFVELAQRTRPDIETFADLYADWAVANALNIPDVADGRYAYGLLPDVAQTTPIDSENVTTTVNQFGVHYLGPIRGPLNLRFSGEKIVGLTGAEPASGSYMWWSKRGDDSVSTLTHAFDLSDVQEATLEFSTWFEIERHWDYGYVSVSTDGGTTWTSLQGSTTFDEDPQGQNLGHGLTGVSGAPGVEPEKGTRGEWVEERMDLTPFAGQEILVRFWLVQDASYNAQGLLVDNIRIPAIGWSDDAEAGDGQWQAEGFVRTTGFLEQLWELRLISAVGGQIDVERIDVDQDGQATIEVAPGEQALLAVMATTDFTNEPATYSYRATPPANTSGGTP